MAFPPLSLKVSIPTFSSYSDYSLNPKLSFIIIFLAFLIVWLRFSCHSGMFQCFRFITKPFRKYLKGLDYSAEYFTGILSLIFLGATIIPISNRISKFEIDYLRKKYDPYLEINSLKTKTNHGKITLKSNYLSKAQIIFFTSGTTGKPKGILHKISNLLISANNFSILANYKKCKVILHNWPHYYMAGFFNMFLCPILNGVSIFFDDEISNDTYLKYWNRIFQSKIEQHMHSSRNNPPS